LTVYLRARPSPHFTLWSSMQCSLKTLIIPVQCTHYLYIGKLMLSIELYIVSFLHFILTVYLVMHLCSFRLAGSACSNNSLDDCLLGHSLSWERSSRVGFATPPGEYTGTRNKLRARVWTPGSDAMTSYDENTLDEKSNSTTTIIMTHSEQNMNYSLIQNS